MGVDIIAVREVSRDKSLLPVYITNMILLKISFAVVAFLAISGVAYFLAKSHEVFVLIILYGLTLFPLAMSTEWFFQGIEKMKFVGLFRVFREAVYALLIVALITRADRLYFVPVFRFAGIFCAALFLMYRIRKAGFSLVQKMDFKVWKYLTRESLPIIGSQLMILLIYNFPVIFLGLIRTNEEVGYYNAVYKVILFFIGFASVFWYVIFPSLSRFTVESKEKLLAFQDKVSKIIIIIAVPIGFIGSALASPIINFLYGYPYNGSIAVFRILIWVGTLVMLNGIYAQGLLSSNNQRNFMKTVVVQTSISLIANIVLIPRYGVTGAAVAWLAAEGVGLFLYKFYYNRVIRLSITKYLLRPILAGGLVSLLLMSTSSYDLNVLFKLSAGFILYGMTLVAVRGIVYNDVRFILNSFTLSKG